MNVQVTSGVCVGKHALVHCNSDVIFELNLHASWRSSHSRPMKCSHGRYKAEADVQVHVLR